MRILAVLCALIFCAIAYARQPRAVGDLISGHATTVVDGDTFRISYDRIRIWGIDAPRLRARCTTRGRKWRPGFGSHAALKACLRGTTVTCRVQKIERRFARPRFVAECWRDNDKEDVAACMVRSGWATDYTGYSGGYYAALEEEPKAVQRGLWQCKDGPPTKQWCSKGKGVPCEPIYKPRGPRQS